MTPQDQQFLEGMIERLTGDTRTKFEAGKLEHGGHIWDIPPQRLARETMNEAIDLFTYIYTLEKNLGSLLEHVKRLETENTALKAIGLSVDEGIGWSE